jgi:protein associated with RNAse G/E
MGAGILPTAIHQKKLYFLFGKENKYEESAPGWCDFGGGTEKGETFLDTKVREGTEELTGFLGSEQELKRKIQQGTYDILFNDDKYQMSILPLKYDPMLPYYYNNNQRFLQKRLEPDLIKNSRIFEKEEIKWVCIDDIPKMNKQFRHYFRDVAKMILEQRKEIYSFINIKNKTISKKNPKRTQKRHKNIKIVTFVKKEKTRKRK